MNPGLALALIVFLGAASQWIAWRVGVPAILPLLIAGFLVGPIGGLMQPVDVFGREVLFSCVSLAVGLILFEGSTTLRFPEVKEVRRITMRLLTIGALISWVGAAAAAYLFTGVSWGIAFLFGALVLVTGPTVIGPLLRIVRPNQRVSSVLRWEGIIIDPFGALAAVVVFEFIKAENRFAAAGEVMAMLAKFSLVGIVVGVIGGIILAQIIRRRVVPDYLVNVVALALVFGVFAASNYFAEEAGLLATVVMGMWLANSHLPGISHLLSFKEDLAILSVSSLFVALAANISLPDLLSLARWEYLALLGVMIFVVRPANVFVSGIGSVLNLREKVFLSAIAPRGIVAASVASIFAFRLEDIGYIGGDRLLALVFLIIVGTVLLNSLTAKPIAKLLNVREPDARGFLIIGAHEFARRIAAFLQAAGIRVLVADTNRGNIAAARLQGIPAYHGSMLSGASDGDIDLTGVGRLLALTSNDEANALSSLRFSKDFGKENVFQIASGSVSDRQMLAEDTRGNLAFGDDVNFDTLEEMFINGATLKETKLTETFTYEMYLKQHEEAVPLFLRRNGRIEVIDDRNPLIGDGVIAAVRSTS